MERLPFDIREAIVQACGKAFWLKDPFRAFLLSAGVPANVYDRYAEESKYKITRHVLADLDARGDDGILIQRRITTELCKLRDVPDPTVPDGDAALKALRWLKELAVAQRLLVDEQRSQSEQRVLDARRRQAALAARAQRWKNCGTLLSTGNGAGRPAETWVRP